MNIVTGYKGIAHITAQQDRFINQACLGTGTYVLPTGNQLSCTIDSATQISIADGGLSLQGCVGIIDPGLTETFAVDDGSVGMYRTDYVCAVYAKDSDGIESIALEVKTGTATSGTPTPPSYTSGSIEDGDTLVEAPIWRINIEGLAIASVERVAPIVSSSADLMTSISSVTSLISGRTPFYSMTSSADADTLIDELAIRTVFTFLGTSAFSQGVLGLSTQTNAFGIGFKSASSTIVFFAICGGNLYYTAYKPDGTGTVYMPVNLTTNV